MNVVYYLDLAVWFLLGACVVYMFWDRRCSQKAAAELKPTDPARKPSAMKRLGGLVLALLAGALMVVLRMAMTADGRQRIKALFTRKKKIEAAVAEPAAATTTPAAAVTVEQKI